MTPAEASAKLHRAADYLLLTYYESTGTPEQAEAGFDIGCAVGLLYALAQRLDGRARPSTGWARLMELRRRPRAHVLKRGFTGRMAMKCKHDACHCDGSDVQQDGYCSQSCREQKTAGGNCSCGHPPCRR